jgi:regulator of cell morphogenesis and NO signaling
VLESFRIDYCCGGRKRLADACREAGAEVESVLEALRRDEAAPRACDEHDRGWADADSRELVEHILAVHHEFLRRELPRLGGLIDKVVNAHGGKHAELPEVQATFRELRDELESHMAKEENILFPAIADSTAGLWRGRLDGPIGVMEHEHVLAGRALEALRDLTRAYAPPADACNTYRAMLDGLAELERDLHRHIHEENNILFPRFA